MKTQRHRKQKNKSKQDTENEARQEGDILDLMDLQERQIRERTLIVKSFRVSTILGTSSSKSCKRSLLLSVIPFKAFC